VDDQQQQVHQVNATHSYAALPNADSGFHTSIAHLGAFDALTETLLRRVRRVFNRTDLEKAFNHVA